jgi:hypothetical protein
MRKENEHMRQKSSIRLETKIQKITKEVELVLKGTSKELAICVQNCKNKCTKVNKNVNYLKAQTKTNVDRLKVNQNKEGIEKILDELSREVRTVQSIVDECNGGIQRDKRSHRLDIQRLDSHLEELKERVKSSMANKAETTVRASPQTSPTIRLIDTDRSTSQAAQNVRGTNSCHSFGDIDVIVDGTSDSNKVRNLNTVRATSRNIVSALPDRYVAKIH